MRQIEPTRRITGSVRVPSDKSLTHRAILFGALAAGETIVKSPLDAADTRSSAECCAALGAHIEWIDDRICIKGGQVMEPDGVLFCGNSGTTMRLLLGMLAGRQGLYVLDGDASLRSRPMRRLVEPLRAMGAELRGRRGDTTAPMALLGGKLEGRDFRLPVASAQVKSALLLAGLRAQGVTTVIEPSASRDHTERLLPLFGATISRDGCSASVLGPQTLQGTVVDIPGDPSSAAFFLALAAILPGSCLRVEHLGLNRTRTGFLDVLRRFGADVTFEIEQQQPEPIGAVTVRAHKRLPVEVMADEVPTLIDELPLVAVLGAFAKGVTRVRGAAELRHKESDRIEAIRAGLGALGGQIEAQPDGFDVIGGALRGGVIDSFGDHRIAMALAVAAAAAGQPSTLHGDEAVAISYPAFFEQLQKLTS